MSEPLPVPVPVCAHRPGPACYAGSGPGPLRLREQALVTAEVQDPRAPTARCRGSVEWAPRSLCNAYRAERRTCERASLPALRRRGQEASSSSLRSLIALTGPTSARSPRSRFARSVRMSRHDLRCPRSDGGCLLVWPGSRGAPHLSPRCPRRLRHLRDRADRHGLPRDGLVAVFLVARALRACRVLGPGDWAGGGANS